MNTEATYKTATPAEVDRIMIEANALRNAYVAESVSKMTRKLMGLLRGTPRGQIAA